MKKIEDRRYPVPRWTIPIELLVKIQIRAEEAIERGETTSESRYIEQILRDHLVGSGIRAGISNECVKSV